MSQRFFLTAESTYEALRQGLNTALSYPNELGKSVFQTALYAPRDTFRRVLLAVDTDLPGYITISAAIAPLLESDAMEEIDEGTYLAALATATAGASDFSSVTDTLTYSNFLPSGGSLATAFSGINDALDGKANASDFDQGLTTADDVTFNKITASRLDIANDGTVITTQDGLVIGKRTGAFGPLITSTGDTGLLQNFDIVPQSIDLTNATIVGLASVATSGSAADLSGTLNASRLPSTAVTAGSYGGASSVATFTVDATGRLTAAGSTSIAIAAGAVSGLATIATSGSASDLSAGTVPIARLPTGTTSTTVAIGSHTHAASDIASGVINTARLASSGTASSSTFLRGDQTWATAGSSSASDLTSGTLAYARMADPTVTSPSQITASQNDYASFARGINRFTTNAARDITGMVAGSDGEVRVLCNVGTTAANTLTIKDESTSSTAANRFSVPWNGDCVIPAEGSVVVFYDGTSSRWRVI